MASKKKVKGRKSTAQEPFMIRGDRLLLALEVLEALDRPPIVGETDPRWNWLRKDRVCSTLRKKGVNSGEEPMRGEYMRAFFSIRVLLRSNQQLETAMLEIGPLLVRDRFIDSPLRPFFSAIASGELTEVDFKE